MATSDWHPRKRNYVAERKAETVVREETSSHPLKLITVTVTESRIKKVGRGGGSQTSSGKSSRSSSVSSMALDPLSSALEGTDPLSQMAAQAADPLSQMALSDTRPLRSGSPATAAASSGDLEDTFEPWSAKRPGILSKYTTSEKLSITTSFLSASDKEKVVTKAPSTVSDKVRNRLEQLDDFEEGSVKEMLNLSQQDYVNRIDELNNALILAWDQDQRVKALKIVIQCAKLLADVSVIQFYPSKFVLITDILDTFGLLVFDRIKTKAQYYPKGSSAPVQLPENFTPGQVPESAKETCRNWFFKIASIRELIPRFYVEAAILKCYGFLTTGEYSQALRRLSTMTRGIGNPLVAIYSRCYLCRVGIKVAPQIRNHIMPCFDDFLSSYQQVQGDSVQNTLAAQKLEMPRYLTLYSPALDWILQCLAHNASDSTLHNVMEKCRKRCNSALLLNSIMSAFKPEYISARAMEFTQMIKDCEESGFPKYLLYRSLGTCLVMADPPEDQKLNLLNDVWKVVMKLKNPTDYIACSEVWIEYVVKNFSKREVNTILADIIKHMSPDRAFEDFYPQLQSVVCKILVHMHDFSTLFSMDKFLPFIDMFQKDSVKVEVCKSIMEAYVRHQVESTNDPVIINAVMFICKTMHDSVNALTIEDEVRSIGNFISGFIRSISFGRDFEQQLSFCVEARAAFSNIDTVLQSLVHTVNNLAMQTHKIVKGNHSRKTAAFIRACAAYSFITIPSLQGVFSRLNLYLVSAEVAFLNNCLSQGDAFIKAAISLLADVPKMIELDGKMRSSEPMLIEYLSHLSSLLLVVPDNPDTGVLYVARGLLNMLTNYPWEGHSDARLYVYMNILSMLSAMSQEDFIYHLDKVDSNDRLYGNDPKFLGEVDKVTSTLLDLVLQHLKVLDQPETYKRQAVLAHALFNHVVAHSDLVNSNMLTLATNLWNLAQKNGQLDTKIMVRTLDYVKRRAASSDNNGFSELVGRMALQSRA